MTVFQGILAVILVGLWSFIIARFLLNVPCELKRIADALNRGFVMQVKHTEDTDDE